MTSLFSFNSTKRPAVFTKYSLLAVTLSFALSGCNSNSAETTQSNSTSDAVSASETSVSADKTTNNANPKSDPNVVAALEKNFKASGFDQKVTSAIPTQMDNIYWVTSDDMPAFFTDKDGRYIIQGQIVEIGQQQPVDIGTELIAQTAKQKLNALSKDEMIVFPAKGETKAVVYTFTDADCVYCRKLHSEINDINAAGVEVRYLAWPRTEQSIPKMEAIWCSEDRMAAMDQAKAGQNVIAPTCDSPVKSHIQLGMSLGVNGTPAIFTESGHQIGGYLPAKDLAQAAIADS